MKKISYILLVVILSISGCESTVQNFTIENPDPKLAVYSYAGADSTLKVYVSRNMGLNEILGLYPQTNALVELYKGNELLSSPKIGENDFYIDSTFHFENNTNYTLRVSQKDFPATETIFNIPDEPIVYSIDTAIAWSGTPGCPDCSNFPNVRITIHFENPPETIDYFSVEVTSKRYGYIWDNNSQTMEDPDTFLNNYRVYIKSNAPYIKTTQSWGGFINVSQPSESYGERFFFNDELLEKGENTLIIEAEASSIVDVYSEEEPQAFSVNFRRIDENLMEYVYSKGKNYLAEDNPFVEPVTIFSNVENGLGLVTGYSVYSKTFSADSISKLIPEGNFSY